MLGWPYHQQIKQGNYARTQHQLIAGITFSSKLPIKREGSRAPCSARHGTPALWARSRAHSYRRSLLSGALVVYGRGAPLMYRNYLYIPVYSRESEGKTEHNLALDCTGNAHLDGSCPSIEVWHRFLVLHDLNWTVLELRRGIAQMIEATGPISPGEPLPIHLLGGGPKGFVIYNDLHKILLVQCIDYKEQGTPTSEWKVFSEVERKIDKWSATSGPLRLRNTLTVTFAGSGDSPIAATLVLRRIGGWFDNGINGELTLSNESRPLTHYTAGFRPHSTPPKELLLTSENANRWPCLRLPLEQS
jgi:hypothetical protein